MQPHNCNGSPKIRIPGLDLGVYGYWGKKFFHSMCTEQKSFSMPFLASNTDFFCPADAFSGSSAAHTFLLPSAQALFSHTFDFPLGPSALLGLYQTSAAASGT